LTNYNTVLQLLYKISINCLFFIFLFFLINFEKSLGYFSVFNSGAPSLISIAIYLCIRKLNLNPSNILIFFLGILNDIITSVNLGISSIFFLLIKLLTENLSIFRLNDNNQQAWLSFTIVFSVSFFVIILLNIGINLSFFDINPLLFHMGTTLIFFPIINAGFDLIFFISRLIKTDS